MTRLAFTKKSNYSRCFNSAIYSLAMREHSRQELAQKLKAKEFSEGVDIDALLDELEESNYLNEERFVESFIRYKSSRGQGLLKITNELKKRGVCSSLIQTAMKDAELSWFDLAHEQLIKKFGDKKPKDYKEKTRQMRFLAGRGFSTDVIYEVMGS